MKRRNVVVLSVTFCLAAAAGASAAGGPACGKVKERNAIGSYWDCWIPALCADDYLRFADRAARSSSEDQIGKQLCSICLGTTPVFSQPHDRWEVGLAKALNIAPVLKSLDSGTLSVRLIRYEPPNGSVAYHRRELLFDDPYVGTFKGILLTPSGNGPFPAVVALHGHSETAESYLETHQGYTYPAKGLALLAITFRVMEPAVMEHFVTNMLLLHGHNLIGLRSYEAMIALKYLACRSDVKAVGLIGHSGGASTGNLVVLLRPDLVRAYVSDYQVDYFTYLSSCSPNYYQCVPLFPERYHCETAPAVYPYNLLINDFDTLTRPFCRAAYGNDAECTHRNVQQDIRDFFLEHLTQ